MILQVNHTYLVKLTNGKTIYVSVIQADLDGKFYRVESQDDVMFLLNNSAIIGAIPKYDKDELTCAKMKLDSCLGESEELTW
jgi:hypothetical protein